VAVAEQEVAAQVVLAAEQRAAPAALEGQQVQQAARVQLAAQRRARAIQVRQAVA
jgi:hypothetical protein